MNAHDMVLIGRLVDRCPSLLPVLQEHLDDHHCLLSHLFMATHTRWSVQRYLADTRDAELMRTIEYLNEAF